MSKPILRIFEDDIAPVRYRMTRKPVLGLCEDDGKITIHHKQSEEERMDTVIHEVIHHLQPEATEEEVIRQASLLSTVLWKAGYRRTLL